MLNSGHHVKAVWTDGQMYGARVLQFNGSHYLVAWDDGAPAGWVSVDQIQVHPDGGTPFVIGQNVKARWTDGSMYGARLTQFNGMQYEVAWADGAAPTWLSPHQIQLDTGAAGGPQFVSGQRVKAQWTDGGFYGARILQFNGMQYEVAWDDGAPHQWLAAHQIHADTGAPNPGYAAPNQGYGAPNQGYAAPNQGYGAPNQGYPAPNPGFASGTGAGIGIAPGPQRGMDAYQPSQPSEQHAINARNAAMAGVGDARNPGMGASYAVGQPVLAPWTDGSMYGARVMQFNGSHYLVAWDDGAPPAWFSPSQIHPR